MGCTLQGVAINAVATAVSRGSLATKQLSVLPIDLLQLVLDKLVQKGEPFSADVDITLEDSRSAAVWNCKVLVQVMHPLMTAL